MSATQVGTHHEGGRRFLELQRCSLLVLRGDERGREAVVDRDPFRIGKSPDNDLVLAHETVSRSHCTIVRDAGGYLLRDLGSTNGTRLDGAPVREAYLTPGAVIEVGKVELQVKTGTEKIELLPSEKESFGELVGRSLRMRELFGVLERVAPTDATLLVGGETGTGKDVLARSVHAASLRARRPLIVVDCGAVVGTLIESELFGHEKGAFTGATAQRKGAFELADGGTLFLDEIGELPLDLQPKLLRVLEQRAFRRVGGTREVPVDVRVIAASKRNLKMEVERGKFREDLYFRLAVVPVELPPLRERREDLPLLVERLLAAIAEREPGRPTLRLEPAALRAFAGHDWPGNVRELRNVLERASYLGGAGSEGLVRAADLPFAGPGGAGAADAIAGGHELVPPFEPGKSYRDTKAAFEELFERRFVTWLLGQHGGNVSAAARAADMDRKYLHKLAKKHGLDRTS